MLSEIKNILNGLAIRLQNRKKKMSHEQTFVGQYKYVKEWHIAHQLPPTLNVQYFK